MPCCSKSSCAAYLSAVLTTISVSGSSSGAPSSSRRWASWTESMSVTGMTSPTPRSRTISAKVGMYAGSSTRGTRACSSAWWSVGASGSASAATVVAPACWKAVTTSTRIPAHVNKTVVTGPSLVAPAAGLALVRPREERLRRAREDLQVDPGGAVVDVPAVELDPVLPRQLRATVDLRPARQARLDLEPAALSRRVALDLVGKRRARADQAHLPAQDVPELRDLVEREAAQKAADARDPRVALVDRPAGPLRLGADDHRPQLEQLEVGSVLPDAPLPVEDRSAVVELDRKRGQREQRRREEQE